MWISLVTLLGSLLTFVVALGTYWWRNLFVNSTVVSGIFWRFCYIASWAGFPAGAVRPVLERMDLQTFRDEDGRELVDLPGAPLPEPDTPAPVRFLHTWEALLLVHARRSEVLSEEYRPRVFNTRTPHSVPTFLVDGQVAGTWRYDKDRIVTEPFRRLTPSVRREVEEEAEGLAAFHAE